MAIWKAEESKRKILNERRLVWLNKSEVLTYDSCPKCESVFTEEVLSFMEDEDASQSPNMKCLDCGHLFSGESYDSCPECFTTMTEEINLERDDEY